MVDVRVGIIGLGSVGQGVVKILSDNISLKSSSVLFLFLNISFKKLLSSSFAL